MTPLTPAEIIKDIKTLDRIERDWLLEGRLDAITEEDITYKRGDLMDQLRQRFHTEEHTWWVGKDDRWLAFDGEKEGDYDDDAGRWLPTVKYAYGATELEAIETLLELIGEDA